MSEENRPFASLPVKRATIKDVARAAKVSPMTVSNVLNNKNHLVSSKTRTRVEREVARLNYRRQSAAQNLRGATQDSVGMIIIDPSPYFLAALTKKYLSFLCVKVSYFALVVPPYLKKSNSSLVKCNLIARYFLYASYPSFIVSYLIRLQSIVYQILLVLLSLVP